MEIFLQNVVPRIVPDIEFSVHAHQGKYDLLRKLRKRLKGYAQWLPKDRRIVVLVDRDDEACEELKHRLEDDAKAAGLSSRTASGSADWQVVSRIAVEELEAWYFGDWDAVRTCYPKVPATVANRAGYRSPDAIKGGTWEQLERVLQAAGYFKGGLEKLAVANAVGTRFDPQRCSSPSFVRFRDVLLEATA
ncbi:hypothetical protein GGQ63_001879 [Prosthecomicrobium pneumaticum]|uniref:DUF4276 family protein n=2 Tax=Prosthecomicrobium pneumaticum TaxID=81895 RepID=A0A7W9L1J0_9HYPH|nr:hypothetical protein [Prosthecomicrobium pneumaticum]